RRRGPRVEVEELAGGLRVEIGWAAEGRGGADVFALDRPDAHRDLRPSKSGPDGDEVAGREQAQPLVGLARVPADSFRRALDVEIERVEPDEEIVHVAGRRFGDARDPQRRQYADEAALAAAAHEVDGRADRELAHRRVFRALAAERGE